MSPAFGEELERRCLFAEQGGILVAEQVCSQSDLSVEWLMAQPGRPEGTEVARSAAAGY